MALIHVQLTDETVDDAGEIARLLALVAIEQEFRLRTLANAHLRRIAANKRHGRVDALGQIEEEQVWLIGDGAVDAAFPAQRIGRHQHPVQVAVFYGCSNGWHFIRIIGGFFFWKNILARRIGVAVNGLGEAITISSNESPAAQEGNENQQASDVRA